MKKQVIYGYVGKSVKAPLKFQEGLSCALIADVHSNRGAKYLWFDEDWPPILVRVTVEEVKP